jgi:hypothetical protein
VEILDVAHGSIPLQMRLQLLGNEKYAFLDGTKLGEFFIGINIIWLKLIFTIIWLNNQSI